MDVSLSGKVIVVTGAARGVGASIAAACAESGAEALVLVDRDPVEAVFDCPTETITTDLAVPEAPSQVMATSIARFGRVDGLVNAAGLTSRGSFLDTEPAFWDRMMAVNARAPFFLMAGAIQDMRARQSAGSIVNIQSMNAHGGASDLAVYSTTKGALQTMTKNAAHAHLRDRIRVNGLNLGWVDTETERHLHEVTLGKGDGWLEAQGAALPLGRFVSVDDAARAAVWLLSDASAPMTGVSMDLEQMVLGGLG